MKERRAPIISIRGLSTRFGNDVIHEHIDLEVKRGEILALVGASGSGKTTLLREMIGLQLPSAGTVKVLGTDINAASRSSLDEQRRLRSRWGVLFQRGALFSSLTVEENIAFPLRELKLLKRKQIARLVRLKLAMVGLQPGVGQQLPSELSGGMIKRVALARALATDPELLLLDEPTSGLDPISSEEFVMLLKKLQKQLGLTTVMVTHDLDTIVDLCDRVAVLADKHLAALDTPQAVAQVEHHFIQAFFNGTRGQRAFQTAPPATDRQQES